MGALQVGDRVFDDLGQPSEVTAVSQIYERHRCYRVNFCDGESIVADAGHKWAVNKGRRKTPYVMTTQEMVDAGLKYLTGAYKFVVPVAGELDTEPAILPVDPYVLGVWLGDGHSYSAYIHLGKADSDIADEVTRRGISLRKYTEKNNTLSLLMEGVQGQLRALSVLRNKHIPSSYLRGSTEQRWDLLHGLMDTDGTSDPSTGTSSFSSVNERLADGVFELAASLGLRPRKKYHRAVLNGEDMGPCYQISMFAYADEKPLFKCARKLGMQRRKSAISRPSINKYRRIVSIEAVPSVPVKCISVASPSRLYLAGKNMVPTHNTETCVNTIGQRMDDDPVPCLYVGPSRSFVTKQMEPRLSAMIQECDSLRSKLAGGKKDTTTRKLISGIPLNLAWAGSATELAGFSAGLAILDERDRMDSNVKGEGDPVELVETRGDTYPDFTLFITSTPLIGNVDEVYDEEAKLYRWGVSEPEQIQSPTWKLWQEGTRHEWAWPCPDCGEYFIPRFNLLKWPKGATPAVAEREAYIACPHCGSCIENHHKAAMNAKGRPVAPGQKVLPDGTVIGDPPHTDTYSLWVSGLCSPFRTFGQRASRFIKAHKSGDMARIQTALNTGFGELLKVGGGSAPAWTEIAERREMYAFGEVPRQVQKVSLSVDVQGDRLIYGARGWGAKWESWLLDAGDMWGDTRLDTTWDQLQRYIAEGVGGRQFDMILVDSGFRPGKPFAVPLHMVYEFARRNKHLNVRATKGQNTMDKPFKMKRIDVNHNGIVVKKGLELWHLDTDYFKRWVQSHVHVDAGESEDGEATPATQQFHFGRDATDDYCRAMFSEVREVLPSGRIVWTRIHKENHFLDIEAMNVAAAHMLAVHRLVPINDDDKPKQQKSVGSRLAAMNR